MTTRLLLAPALGDRWVNADGTLAVDVLRDLLHRSEAGYLRWAEEVLPAPREALSDARVPRR